MTNLQTLTLVNIGLIFFLSACGSVTLPTLCNQASACLKLDIRLQEPTKQSQNLATDYPDNFLMNDDHHPKAPSLNASIPVIANKADQLVRLSSTLDLNAFQKVTNSIENEQVVKGFEFNEVQGHHLLLNTEQIWQISQGEGIVIAVIDSGIDSKHEALKNSLLPGFDFIENTYSTSHAEKHGTAVASLIAGQKGIYGLAPKVKIMPLRVLDEYNQGSLFDLSRAILFAANLLPEHNNPYPAQIINLSLGISFDSTSLHEVIKKVTQAGVLIVAAAGNSGQDGLHYPAAYPEVIGVGAAQLINGDWSKEVYSSYGQGLSFLAPTGGIATTNLGRYSESSPLAAQAHTLNGSTRFGGTSAAAPLVSGLIALMLSAGLRPADVLPILKQTSINLGDAGWDKNSGYGVINPMASLRAATRPNALGIAVQVTDGQSLQEQAFFVGDQEQLLSLKPGIYTLYIWHDLNGDGIRQITEAQTRVEHISIDNVGVTTSLELNLKETSGTSL